MKGAKGLDHAGRPADYPRFARAAVAAGYRFEWRYLCRPETRDLNRSKIARPDEVAAARAAGLDVLLIWQDTKHDAAGGFEAGHANGAAAAWQAGVLGYPLGRAIYFAVADYDAPASDHPLLADYLRGVRTAIAGRWQVGGYGKNLVGRAMLDAGVVDLWWQSYGFSRPVGVVEPWAACYQRREQVTVDGVLCDVNDALVDEMGQWEREDAPVRVTWIADVLRRAGVSVYELPGWRGRGREMVAVRAVIVHATATPPPPQMHDGTLDAILRDGRKGLPGPLCQLGPKRTGSVTVVADGRGNHNGYGTYGNETVGIEIANNNAGEPITDAAMDASLRSTAGIALHERRNPDRTFVLAHKESDPTRKSDPIGVNMDWYRHAVGLHMLTLSGYQAPAPAPAPAPLPPIVRGLRVRELQGALMRVPIDVPLDDNGRGWTILDGVDGRPHVPFGHLISVRPQGSNPGRDGYWPLPETGEQDSNGFTLLTVEGGIPSQTSRLYLVVPDA